MNETLQKAEDYLRRAEQGFFTELGEGDALLKNLVEKVKDLFSLKSSQYLEPQDTAKIEAQAPVEPSEPQTDEKVEATAPTPERIPEPATVEPAPEHSSD